MLIIENTFAICFYRHVTSIMCTYMYDCESIVHDVILTSTSSLTLI